MITFTFDNLTATFVATFTCRFCGTTVRVAGIQSSIVQHAMYPTPEVDTYGLPYESRIMLGNEACMHCLTKRRLHEFKPGEHVIYKNGDSYALGKIKNITERGAFVYYHDGDTASLTRFEDMHKLTNEHTILMTSLGGGPKL